MEFVAEDTPNLLLLSLKHAAFTRSEMSYKLLVLNFEILMQKSEILLVEVH